MIKLGYGNSASINESTSSKEYTILIQRKGKVREVTGTLDYLIDHFGSTLETGIALEQEKGSYKINRYPRDIKSLIKNLNNAKANSAMQGFNTIRELYTLKENFDCSTINESTKFDAMTPNSKVADQARKLVAQAKKSGDSKDAWAVVDFLYDFPNALCESIDSSTMNESSGSHPKLGKKVKQIKGWKIYQGTNSSGNEVFRCFTPDDEYFAVGYEDWECETLDQAIEWIKNY